MKVYAQIALMIFHIAACTKSTPGSQESKTPEPMEEQESIADPSSQDQENGNAKPDSESSSSDSTPPMDPKAPTETPMPEPGSVPPATGSTTNQVSVEFGILNFRQYLATISSLTGVRLNNPAAIGGVAPAIEYARASSNLPSNNSIYSFSPVHISFMTRLSSSFCDVLANSTTLLEAKFPGLSLADTPSDSVSYARTLVTVFYGPETFLQAPRATDIASVAAAVDILKALPEATGTGVFVATCSALLSAAEVTLY